MVCDRDVEGDRLAARQVLRRLVTDPRTDALDPILVTGSVFWVDDDLWPRLAGRLPDLPWAAVDGHHELDTTGWKTVDRVALATRLLTEGVTRCLVGTRHLLGEGWDCPAVCCVVDLTGITASVTVQQVRGRALRPDPADPSKIASLWDVVALAPGVPDGDRMLRRLRDRHRHTFGVDDQGRVVTGVARIDPRLAHDVTLVAAAAESLQAKMNERLRGRDEVAERWAVGKDYRDARIWQVAAPSPTSRPVLPALSRPEPEVAAGPRAMVTRLAAEHHALDRRVRALRVGTALVGGTVGLVGGGILSALGPLSVLVSVGGTVELLGGIFLSALGPLSLVSSVFGVAGGLCSADSPGRASAVASGPRSIATPPSLMPCTPLSCRPGRRSAPSTAQKTGCGPTDPMGVAASPRLPRPSWAPFAIPATCSSRPTARPGRFPWSWARVEISPTPWPPPGVRTLGLLGGLCALRGRQGSASGRLEGRGPYPGLRCGGGELGVAFSSLGRAFGIYIPRSIAW